MRKVFAVGAALALLGLGLAAQAAVTIETVAVGNAGNAADSNGLGAVNYAYNIGKYEITVGQYTEFLNYKEVDKSTPLLMSNNGLAANQIELVGDGSAVNPFLFRSTERTHAPVIHVSYWNACRFVNWLSNGQGNGDTETGTYTLSNTDSAGAAITRNPGAKWFLPTIDEWYKAAYNSGSGYYDQPTASSYGTVDQYGNGWEWSESVASLGAVSGRILAGGYGPGDQSVPIDFKGSSLGDPSRSHGPVEPWAQDVAYSFRVAAVPEPSSMIALAGGLMSLLAMRRRRA